jgi:hypothetical protein
MTEWDEPTENDDTDPGIAGGGGAAAVLGDDADEEEADVHGDRLDDADDGETV